MTPRSARPRKLDAATEQQAIASARDLIERSGGLSHGMRSWRKSSSLTHSKAMRMPAKCCARWRPSF